MHDHGVSANSIRHLDDLSARNSAAHRLHPVAKLATVFLFIIAVASFDRYSILALVPFAAFPVVFFAMSGLPARGILRRLLFLEPFVLVMGIFNPVFDRVPVELAGGLVLVRGWASFLSLFVRSGLTISAALLLVATTGMDSVAAALRTLKMPKQLVLQLLLTYRYVVVLLDEVGRSLRAYFLRAPGQKGIAPTAWGSFGGRILVRTVDRAENVYQAMNLRGFEGDFRTGPAARFGGKDAIFLIGWAVFFVLARWVDLPLAAGTFLTGVFR
jgi:cobalt/nickel transport system permease protein